MVYPPGNFSATAESRRSRAGNAQTGLDARRKLATRLTPIISKAGFMDRA
jgi:hypothetical protein